MAHRKQPPVAALVAAIISVQALLMLWFAWPAQNVEPRDLPIVVAGPPPAAAAFADRLRAARPGAFEITTVADAAAADEKLRDRAAYGAFVVAPDGVTLHTASAASPTVAAALTQAAGAGVRVVDVVPAGADDPRGAGLASAFLPLLLTSILAGAVLALAVSAPLARIAGLIGYGVGAGLLGAAIMHWTGLLGGSYLTGAGAIALLTLAIASTITGLTAVFGPAGIGIGALLIFVIGNPLSGLAAAPELLPQPWGALGQYLPPGAGVTLLRSVGFFDGAAAMSPVLVLVTYILLGLILVGVGARRRRPAASDRAPVPQTAPVGA